MRHDFLSRHVHVTGVLAMLATAAPCIAQAPAVPASSATPAAPAAHATHEAPPAALAADDAAALARIAVAIAQVRDSTQKQLAQVRNKTPEAQAHLRGQAATEVASLLKQANLTEAEYRQRTYLVSTDTAARRVYDETMAKLTGTPVSGPAAAAANVALPAGPLGAHLGHILQSFGDTPNKQGLLPTALAEARTAAMHAGLAARDPNDLAAMQLHAGHVLHAVDPAEGSSGPGLGYGVRRAAAGVASHVEMAGEVKGIAPAAATHAEHVAAAAHNTVRRAEEMEAFVRRIQAAKTASEAAALVSQLVSVASELEDGKDSDANGRVDWKEGGLRLAEEHMKLLVTAAAP